MKLRFCLLLALLLPVVPAAARELTPMEKALLALHAKSQKPAAVQAAGNSLAAGLGVLPAGLAGGAAGNTLSAQMPAALTANQLPHPGGFQPPTFDQAQDPFCLTATSTVDYVTLAWSNTGTAWTGFAGYNVIKAAGETRAQVATLSLIQPTVNPTPNPFQTMPTSGGTNSAMFGGARITAPAMPTPPVFTIPAYQGVTPPAQTTAGAPASSPGTTLTAQTTAPSAPMTLSTYHDITVSAKLWYTYQVAAVDAQGRTLASSKLAGTCLAVAQGPGVPKDMEVNTDEEMVRVRWKSALRGSYDVTGYSVYRSGSMDDPGVCVSRKPVTGNEFLDDSGVSLQPYFYRVLAVDAKGVSSAASTPLGGFARPRNRNGLVLMSTAYRGLGHMDPGFDADLQFTYFIGTLYGEQDKTLSPNALYLDPISLWLLSADAKYVFLTEKTSPVSAAAGFKGGLQLFAGQQTATSGKFTFSSKTELNYLWGTYLSLSHSFGDWGMHGGYLMGSYGDPAFYLSKYMESVSSRHLVFAGFDFPIARRMNSSLEVLYPMLQDGTSRQHPYLVNLHVDRLFNFDIAYLHWDQGWAFLGYFNLRITIFPGN